jgi:SAM-dependent methyltransferase
MLTKLRNLRAHLRQTESTSKINSETIAQIGSNEDLLFTAIRQNVNQNDRALHNVLHCYRHISRLLGLVGESASKKVILEIGTSREPGLPLILLFAGASQYFANNVFTVNDWVSEGYAKLTYLMLSGLMPWDPVPWSDICADEVAETGERIVRLRSEKFVSLSPVPAEEITLAENSVDLIFSFSVLEHVEKPREVVRNMFRMLKPGGLAVHGIDLRDHRNFNKPLDFLAYSSEGYSLNTPASENRWRASDFVDCFTVEGFELLKHRFRDAPLPLTSVGSTDVCDSIMQPFDSLTPKESFDVITPWITEETRAKFDPMYHSKSLADLSILTMAVIMRKPK